MKTLNGVVTQLGDDGFYRVTCADAPPELRDHMLDPTQIGDAKPGDKVTLELQTFGSAYGRWRVVNINADH